MQTLQAGRKAEGFTLLELMLVLCLASILVGWSCLSLRQIWRGSGLSGCEEHFSTLCEHARNRAILSGFPCVLEYSFQRHSWRTRLLPPQGISLDNAVGEQWALGTGLRVREILLEQGKHIRGGVGKLFFSTRGRTHRAVVVFEDAEGEQLSLAVRSVIPGCERCPLPQQFLQAKAVQ